jgi:6-phosphofructokinase 1
MVVSKGFGDRDILGILVGGGPAPGINGVISAATIEAINNGLGVLGIYDGFSWLAKGDTTHVEPLTIEEVSRIHLQGGSVLRTSRENPAKSKVTLEKAAGALTELGIKYLLTIGGDDTAYAASCVAEQVRGLIRVATVPKTIDNDLPLPHGTSTFGYQTARHVGVTIVQSLMEDARTTRRWYIIVTMGRKSGALALGIGKAAGATLTVIGEEFEGKRVRLDDCTNVLLGAIVKRRSMGRTDGVAVLAEGLSESIDPDDLKELVDAERDEFDNIRLGEIDIGTIVKNRLKTRLKELNIPVTVVSKNIGYELRCAPPIPFDLEYTRNLGYGAVKFFLQGGSDAIVSYWGGKLEPIPYTDLIDPKTGRMKVRLVDIHTESYEVARKYMIRLERTDVGSVDRAARLAHFANMKPDEFMNNFSGSIFPNNYKNSYAEKQQQPPAREM